MPSRIQRRRPGIGPLGDHRSSRTDHQGDRGDRDAGPHRVPDRTGGAAPAEGIGRTPPNPDRRRRAPTRRGDSRPAPPGGRPTRSAPLVRGRNAGASSPSEDYGVGVAAVHPCDRTPPTQSGSTRPPERSQATSSRTGRHPVEAIASWPSTPSTYSTKSGPPARHPGSRPPRQSGCRCRSHRGRDGRWQSAIPSRWRCAPRTPASCPPGTAPRRPRRPLRRETAPGRHRWQREPRRRRTRSSSSSANHPSAPSADPAKPGSGSGHPAGVVRHRSDPAQVPGAGTSTPWTATMVRTRVPQNDSLRNPCRESRRRPRVPTPGAGRLRRTAASTADRSARCMSAVRPPSRCSEAIRAVSSPVGARNTSTSIPGWRSWKPVTTASTVSWVTEVYTLRVWRRHHRRRARQAPRGAGRSRRSLERMAPAN